MVEKKDEQKSWKVYETTHKRVRILCAQEDLTQDELAIRSLDAYENLSRTGVSPTEDVPNPNFGNKLDPSQGGKGSRPFVLLAGILRSAPQLVRQAILANLEAFSLVTEEMSGKTGQHAKSASADIEGLIETIEDATRRAKGAGSGKKKASEAYNQRRKA